MKPLPTLQSLIRETGKIPNNFITETGMRCEIERSQMFDGTYRVILWQMRFEKKIHPITIVLGETPEEAEENFKQFILNI